MVDRYAYARGRVARKLKEWKTGTVTLTRTARAASAPTTPWVPGDATLDVYDLDADVRGAEAYANGTTILATDLLVIVSPKARHTQHAGTAVDGSPVVDLEPVMTDTLSIDGDVKAIKKIQPVPAAGAPVRFNVFVGS